MFALASLAAGCALFTDLSGFSDPPPASSTQPDAGGADVFVPNTDGGLPTITGGDGGDASSGCANPPVVIDSAFTTPGTSFDPWTPMQSNVPGYPKIEDFAGDVGAVLIPVPPQDPDAGVLYESARSGLWLAERVPTVAFDVDFEMHVRCPDPNCGDGFAFAWIDATAIAVGQTAATGSALGTPTNLAGGAVAADLFLNEENGDIVVPALQVRSFDTTQTTTDYVFVVAHQAIDPFINKWRKIAISVRGDDVTVRYDGSMNPVLTGKVPSIAKSTVGLTAATGGLVSAAAVRNVHGRFYDCATP